MKKIYSVKEAEIVSPNVTIGAFFLRLLHAATNGHILHLQTRSYAEHKALQTYYENLPDLVDNIIEQYQGAYDVIVEYPNTYEIPIPEPLAEVSYVRNFVAKNRAIVGDYTSLQNQVDELMSLLDSTVYKLTFLK